MKIFIDPGHNYSGFDTGASDNGLKEQDVTFLISEMLKILLERHGHSVKMSRENITDCIGKTIDQSLNQRAQMSNKWGADLFVSIHCNAFDKKARGTETLIYSKNSSAYRVSQKIQKAIVSSLDTLDRGIKERPDLVVLKNTNAPAILVETAFIDNIDDSLLLRYNQKEFAEAIFDGIIESFKNEDVSMGQTVMELKGNIYVQEIEPKNFDIVVCKEEKKQIPLNSYFNCGYFTEERGIGVIPVGNLASGGKIIEQAKDNAYWINLTQKALTTIYTTNDGECGILKTDNLSVIKDLKAAVSGIPIIVGGKYVPYDKITAEGYFGNELYDTWHGFLGIRNGKLVYVAMKCDFNDMCWALVALGIYDAIKLDGGGSFVLKDGRFLECTNDVRKIHNVGVWK